MVIKVAQSHEFDLYASSFHTYTLLCKCFVIVILCRHYMGTAASCRVSVPCKTVWEFASSGPGKISVNLSSWLMWEQKL